MAAPRVPIVVVLGATGAGKSKLAIEIAKVFNGEVISADSMQIYKGLDIISNKVTEEEQNECPHHMISYLDASSRHNTVVDFRDKALPIIDSIFKRGRMPVVVGGTNYYIESLLWDFLIKSKPGNELQSFAEKLQPPRNSTSENVSMMTNSQQTVREFSNNESAHSITMETKKRKFEGDEFATHQPTISPVPKSISEKQFSLSSESSQADQSPKDQQRVIETPSISQFGCQESSSPTTNQSLSSSQTHSEEDRTLPSHVISAENQSMTSIPVSPNHSHDNVSYDVNKSSDSTTEKTQGSESQPLVWLNSLTTPDLYARLMRVDPDTALKHHHNNRRKLLRALQVFYDTGSTLSSILAVQHGDQASGQLKSGPLRFDDPCILWVKCQQPTLNQRLDSRVDSMIERGLVQELEDFDVQVRKLQPPDGDQDGQSAGPLNLQEFPHGILQMIGFKEFNAYLQLSPEDRLTDHGQKLFQTGVNDLKTVTRRYARQQVRWIKNRFCSRPGPYVPPVYAVDTTDLAEWPKTLKHALDVVEASTKGEKPQQEPEPTLDRDNFRHERNVCDVCDGRVFLHFHEWQGHIKSKKHKHNVRLSMKRTELSSILTEREIQLQHARTYDIEDGNDDDNKNDDVQSNKELMS